jgi:hypothetical protein
MRTKTTLALLLATTLVLFAVVRSSTASESEPELDLEPEPEAAD